MSAYKARRQTKRWLDGDCPAGVLCILDNRGKTVDRYTVVYADKVCGATYGDTIYGYRGMSENPFCPQGVGMYGEIKAYELAPFRYRSRPTKWTLLPDAVRCCVLQDLTD